MQQSAHLCHKAVASLAILIIIAGCGRGAPPATTNIAETANENRYALQSQPDSMGDAVDRVVFLEQGWTAAQSVEFYTTPQGSRLVPYSWAVALEQPGSEELFFSLRHVQTLRYLPQAKGPANPDGLPVGFVKDGQHDWLGLTCSACHTTQINHNGVGIRIDGGPALGDVEKLLGTLVESLKVTLEDEEKFERFASKVTTGRNPSLERQILKSQLQYVLSVRQGYNNRNMPKEHRFGYGRVDAFGAILNEVLERGLTIPDNHQDANAPVSYPFLWDTPQHDVVQWNGSAPNKNFGDLARNVGEVLGVFAELDIPESPGVLGYPSSVRIGELRAIEKLLAKLQSPKWPDELPAIDATKKAAGAPIFAEYCGRCHEPINRTDPNRKVIARMSDTGTDPQMASNFRDRTGQTGRLEGTRKFLFLGERFDEVAPGEDILVNAVFGAVIHSPFSPPADRLAQIRDLYVPRVAAAETAEANAYKARPLNGVWATAPFLHNGSVPNLHELLLQASERSKQFYLGRREFDSVHVGFVTDEFEGGFLYKTEDDDGEAIIGNSNLGHEYGTGVSESEGGDGKPALSAEQRWAVLEYLKSL
jgi:mono/diheme cytochrome c family protein